MYYDDFNNDWTLGEYECGYDVDSPSLGEYECGCDYDISDM